MLVDKRVQVGCRRRGFFLDTALPIGEGGENAQIILGKLVDTGTLPIPRLIPHFLRGRGQELGQIVALLLRFPENR